MSSHHQPQKIVNERPIRSHGSGFGPKALNDLDFDYARMALCTYCSWARQTVIFRPFCQKSKEREKKAFCLRKPSLGDL